MAGEDILAIQVRELYQQILHRIAPGKVFKEGFHRIAKIPDARFSMTNVVIERDAREEVFVFHASIYTHGLANPSEGAIFSVVMLSSKPIAQLVGENAIARMTNEISSPDEVLVIRA